MCVHFQNVFASWCRERLKCLFFEYWTLTSQPRLTYLGKEICFISSPGNGWSCCCCQSEVRNPSPTLPGKWNEAADPNLNPMQAVETESIGNSRAGSTSTRRSAKGGKKKKKKRDLWLPPCRRFVRERPLIVLLDLSHRLYPDPFSNASNEYVARCARS